MATEFFGIYSKSVGLFEDPTITNAFKKSPILFSQIMYSYFQNAIPLFNNPIKIQDVLENQNEPSGETEIFEGDGTTTYTITTIPVVNSLFQYIVNEVIVDGNYDSINNTITFQTVIPIGQTGSFQWYFPGDFINTLDNSVQNILARLLVLNWAEKEKNFLLDIRRMLQDTDYKLGSEANSIRSKDNWVANMNTEAKRLMNKYAWGLQYKKN